MMERRTHSALSRLDQFDSWLMLSVLGLGVAGIVMVFNAGAFRSEADSDLYYLSKHLMRFGLGVIAMVVMARIDYSYLRRSWLNWSVMGLALGLLLLTVILPHTPLVESRAGANRWLKFSFLPIQPVEIAKVAIVLFLAKHLSGGYDRLSRSGRRYWLVLAMPLAVALALILQPNFGNAAVILAVFACLLFLAGLPTRIMVAVGAAFPVLIGIGYVFVSKIHDRVDNWWGCLLGHESGYQVEQSLIGIGAGGWHGLGMGAGHQRFFLPDPHTDFIFAVLSEETGLLGAGLLLILFVIFAWRGFRIAQGCGDNFGYLVAAGITSLVMIYAGVNIGMVTGMLPVMGLPLPFVSYGGSALITNMATVGILLNIDSQGRKLRVLQQRVRSL